MLGDKMPPRKRMEKRRGSEKHLFWGLKADGEGKGVRWHCSPLAKCRGEGEAEATEQRCIGETRERKVFQSLMGEIEGS